MIFIVIIVVVIAVYLVYKKRVDNKQLVCSHCGKEFLQKEGVRYFTDGKCICRDCEKKIDPYSGVGSLPFIIRSIKWSYDDYLKCIDFAETMKSESEKFYPDYRFGDLEIDTKNLLFTIKCDFYGAATASRKIMRFKDVQDYSFSLSDITESKGLVRDTITADESFHVDLMLPPLCSADVILQKQVQIKSSKKKLFTEKNYELPEDFEAVMRVFSACEVAAKQMGESMINIDETQKALALFMYDDLREVTKENLKERRNSLIKTFHPDNNESNEAFSQKINNAYDILSKCV